MRNRESGSVILLALGVLLILMAILYSQVVVTASNVKVVGNRTRETQLYAQARYSTPVKFRDLAPSIAAFIQSNASSPSIPKDPNYQTQLQTALDAQWQQCQSSAPTSSRVHVQVWLSAYSCDERLPMLSQYNASLQVTPLSNGMTEYRVPTYIQATTYDGKGNQKSRQSQGYATFRTAPTLPTTTYQLLANTLLEPIPADLIFDGPVHVNGVLNFGGRSNYLSGVSSAAGRIILNGTSVSQDKFSPTPTTPCHPLTGNCPVFSAGLNVSASRLSLPGTDISSSASVRAAPDQQDIVLGKHQGDTGTDVYLCNRTSCDVYWLKPNVGKDKAGYLYHFFQPTAVPPRDGLPFSLPVPDSSTSPWTQIGLANKIFYFPGSIEVRSLVPAGSAFEGALTLSARDSVTITSSLQAQNALCSTYAVKNEHGQIVGAQCDTGVEDTLGLMSQTADIQIGTNAYSHVEGDTQMTLQADLLAPMGNIFLADSTIQHLDWMGTSTSNTFKPDARMRLAYDVRIANPPGFPTLDGVITPPTLSLSQDGPLEVDQ